MSDASPDAAARREAKKAQSRVRILDAAREIFFRDGFMEANLDDVARGAGVAKGTLYRYFENKAELYVAVLAMNGEFFERLHGFLELASAYGIIVEMVFLSNVYAEDVWRLHPLHPKNNVNDLPDFEWPDIMSRRQARKTARSRHIAREMQERGITVRAAGRATLVEEIPEAYKDVAEVVDVVQGAGISRKVVQLRPLGVGRQALRHRLPGGRGAARKGDQQDLFHVRLHAAGPLRERGRRVVG